ncbi:hypothetical protein AGDE_00126 [Angomonas deanei]|nr:hypothetical protein AGDE_00126 [Angomonas deanei]|eukprot:EPY43795.1 hypothetical protein AGDE_00126 [Angomonas deanei]
MEDPAGSSREEITAESKKKARELERLKRINGKLIDTTFEDITVMRNKRLDFQRDGFVVRILGSKSQFDARTGKLREILPPVTNDCCQTFATLSAVILSSLGLAVTLHECCTTSAVNYLLYISAWLHQLTSTAWPNKGIRPTLHDLNECLRLKEFFPSRVCESEFQVVFYNQSGEIVELLRRMCIQRRKRARSESEELSPICGYIIVSGDYTISIFSVSHDIVPEKRSRYSEAWSFYICDSHGTQPWSDKKASVCGSTFGVPSPTHANKKDSGDAVVGIEEGIHLFSVILFTLLEEHKKSLGTSRIPYMTWTPVRRKRGVVLTCAEVVDIIQRAWLPCVLREGNVAKEVRRFDFTPLPCFFSPALVRKKDSFFFLSVSLYTILKSNCFFFFFTKS